MLSNGFGMRVFLCAVALVCVAFLGSNGSICHVKSDDHLTSNGILNGSKVKRKKMELGGN